MNEIDEFYKGLLKGRCNPCKYSKCVNASVNYKFLGCYHEPYKGKYVGEIKSCPKEKQNDRKDVL